MSLWWQLGGIAVLLVVVFVLHRRARSANFERFRTYHARRKYRIVAEPNEPSPDDPAP